MSSKGGQQVLLSELLKWWPQLSSPPWEPGSQGAAVHLPCPHPGHVPRPNLVCVGEEEHGDGGLQQEHQQQQHEELWEVGLASGTASVPGIPHLQASPAQVEP